MVNSVKGAHLGKVVTRSFMMTIPFILINVIFEFIRNIPIPAYQFWLLHGGSLFGEFLSTLSSPFWFPFALITAALIGYNFGSIHKYPVYRSVFLSLTCVCCDIAMLNTTSGHFDPRLVSSAGILTALLSGITACLFFDFLISAHCFLKAKRLTHLNGILSEMVISIVPAMLVLLLFIFISFIIGTLSGGFCLQMVISKPVYSFFAVISRKNPFFLGFFNILLTMVCWCFGINGQNFLYTINTDYALAHLNALSLDPGVNFINETFLNSFTMFGGSGCTMALAIAVLIKSQDKATRDVTKLGILPAVFNMSEIIAYGIPAVLNPSLTIPFIFVPLVNYVIAVPATALCIIPPVTHTVNWTTPFFFSRVAATGSIRGGLFQIILFLLDVELYLPFVKKNDARLRKVFTEDVKELTTYYQKNESEIKDVFLTKEDGLIGETARQLMADFSNAIRKGLANKSERYSDDVLYMVFQPQFDKNDVFQGAEALLRFRHPVAGLIYPPLLIKLAKEGHMLNDLERFVFNDTCYAIRCLRQIPGKESAKISANITGHSVLMPEFIGNIEDAVSRMDITPGSLSIEITEQDTLAVNTESFGKIDRLKGEGHSFLIDDFGMGHTSVSYLQTKLFDEIKLDGSITRDVLTSDEDRKIIRSVAEMGHSLNMTIVAEYVETKEQRDLLCELGCDVFQGYLYSKPVSLEEMLDIAKSA